MQPDNMSEASNSASEAPSQQYVKKAASYKGTPRTAPPRYGGLKQQRRLVAIGDTIPESSSCFGTERGPSYRERLNDIRQTFPQPVSDRCHDAYFGFTIMRAIDKVDSLKSKVPILGATVKNDYKLARQSSLSEEGETVEEVNDELVHKLEGLPIWGHPLTQTNVVCPTTIPSIIGSLLASTYNPNMVADDYSCGLAQTEVEVVAMTAKLIGYDPAQSAGVFTFGGTGTVLYGAKIGLEKALPGIMKTGLCDSQEKAVVIASDHAHYARLTVTGWLGMGYDNAIAVESTLTDEVKTDQLDKKARETIEQGKKIACIIATMGTTDSLGMDDLEQIVNIRDRLVEDYHLDYVPHVHADAVIGWAWASLNDYPFDQNPLGFRQRTVHALRGVVRRISKLHLADSVGIDFHKTGFCPYSSSLVIIKDEKDLGLLTRDGDQMPYLFQSGEYHPGRYTLETSRSGCGILAAYANLKLFGKDGLRSLIGHLVEMAELVKEFLEGNTAAVVLNTGTFGSSTLFRLYPDGVDTWNIVDRERTDANMRESLLKHNQYNRRIYEYMHKNSMAGLGAHISMTSCYRSSEYGEPILALKSYIMSPFIDEENIQAFVNDLKAARRYASDQDIPVE